MEQLTEALTATLLAIQNQVTTRSATSSTPIAIPIFDPRNSDYGAQPWCMEIEKLGTTFSWSSYEQLTRAITGLTGEAREWYSEWKPEDKNWDTFKNEIINLYPAKKNLSERLRKASLYTSEGATSYSEYARKKITLLKALQFNLTEAHLIELVIGDISNETVKIAAFNIESSAMQPDVILGRDLLNRKGIKMLSDYQGVVILGGYEAKREVFAHPI
ncbi:hypothetical protein ABEB36_015552 [Hypothenemus hampei]|uniref:Retrotransposon gag domain-containing protein n=1 Tax=Hypothenemus hampei TaxID=57062 RepID=A0ABD1DZH0_HYPHA